MSTELTYNQALELLPLYVMGTLEPHEMLAMDAYIRAHREFLARLRATEEAVHSVAHAAPEAPLPAGARERVLTRARADLHAPPTSQAADNAAQHTRTSSVPRWPFQGRQAGLGRTAALLGGALLALLLIGGYVTQVQAQLGKLNAQISTMHDVVVNLNAQVQENQAVIGRLVDREVQLAGTARAPSASAALYVTGDEGVLVARGLAPLPADQTYQLWLVIDGVPTPFGVFQTQPGVTTIVAVPIPPDAQRFAIVDVSVEPAGGSRTITKETIVLRGSVS